jgi:hypothetical protein
MQQPQKLLHLNHGNLLFDHSYQNPDEELDGGNRINSQGKQVTDSNVLYQSHLT